MKTIGERLRAERKLKNYSQDAVASMLKVSRQTQTNYEGGDRLPDADYLSRAATVCGFDVGFILGGNKFDNVASGIDEQNLLAWYRLMNGQSQATIYHMAYYLSGTMPRHELPGSFGSK